jgi:hypothetical protein
LVFVAPPEERLDEPELVRRDVVPDVDLDVERVVVPELEPPLLDFVPELRDFVPERDPLLRDFAPELEPLRRDDCCEPPEPPSSPESSSDPRSFFPTPTAAAVASPTAAPVATFFGVDIPSVSSAIGQSPFASLKDVMNRGTILSRTISGPFFASHVPAAPAASSASGMTASRAASQPPEAIDVSSVLEPPFPFSGDLAPFDDPLFDECVNALRAAIAAAPVTAAAAAAFTAVRAPEPPLSVVSSTSFVSFSAMLNPFR